MINDKMNINDAANANPPAPQVTAMDQGISYHAYHAKSGYKGSVAESYDRKRQKRKKWKLEIAALEKIVSSFAASSLLLDLPLGTGRFMPLYQRGKHRVLGIDISLDMLQQARAKAGEADLTTTGFAMGDAESIPLADNAVDYVVCIRLLNWVTHPVMKKVIQEFHRVARKGIVIGFRTYQPMGMTDYICLGLRDMVPTPSHLKKWFIGLHRFFNKVKGKLLSVRHPAKHTTSPGKKILTGSHYYEKAEMLALFSRMNMAVTTEIPIDKTASYSKRMVKPYAIYYLRLDKP